MTSGKSGLFTERARDQLELGFEMRAAERHQLLASLGGANLLGAPKFTCTRQSPRERFDCSNDTRVTKGVFVITFAVGYAF